MITIQADQIRPGDIVEYHGERHLVCDVQRRQGAAWAVAGSALPATSASAGHWYCTADGIKSWTTGAATDAHGWTYAGDGRCVRIPQRPEGDPGKGIAVDAFRSGERNPVEELDASLAAIDSSVLNCFSFVAWTEVKRMSLRRKIPSARWPKHLYL